MHANLLYNYIHTPFSCCQSYVSDESNEEESETDNKEKSLSDGERMSAFLICYTRIITSCWAFSIKQASKHFKLVYIII